MSTGIALIAIGFLLCPMLVPTEMYVLDNIMFACGMILAGIGVFLCVCLRYSPDGQGRYPRRSGG